MLLLVAVAWGVISMGVLSAWLVTAYRFPGRDVLEWTLMLPLAMPAYVMAYAYTDWLQFTGPVQAMRDLTGWGAREYWFPEIRSLPGAAAMLVLRSTPTSISSHRVPRNAAQRHRGGAARRSRLWGAFCMPPCRSRGRRSQRAPRSP